jgi:hypothetical protein
MGKVEAHVRDSTLQFMNYKRTLFYFLCSFLFTGWMGTSAAKQGLGTSTINDTGSSFLWGL